MLDWVLPKIKEVTNSGINLYEFICGNMEIEHVGILPQYKEEGYLTVPDKAIGEIKVYRYEMSIITKSGKGYRSLKSSHLYNIPNQKIVNKAPQSIKYELIKRYKELPNPAMFNVHVDIEFPYTESVYPVAKRELISLLVVN